MLPSTPNRSRKAALGACLIAGTAFVLLGGQDAGAQTLTGAVEAYDHPDYAGVASHFRISNASADGVFLYDGELIMFCSDLAARSIDEDITAYPATLSDSNSPLALGPMTQFDVWNRYSTTRDQDLALAQAQWLVDHYYEEYFLEPPAGSVSESQYAFQNAIWEVFGDGGSAAGLSFASGNIQRDQFGPSGSLDSPELWNRMNTLIDAVNASGVTADYQSRYQILGVLDERDGYQDYFALARSPELMAVVPEPGTAGSLLVGFALTCLRHRRR